MDTSIKEIVEMKNDEGQYIIEDSVRFELNEFLNQFPIRIIGTHLNPYFYASDICKILNIERTYRAVENFDEGELINYYDRQEKKIITYKWNGTENRNILLLTEAGVYRLLFKYNSEKTDIFRKWACMAISTIRTTGQYISNREIVQLKTRNEQHLKAIGKLHSSNIILKNKLNAFENLTEYICLFERENDDPREIFSTFMVPKPDRWEWDHLRLDDEEDDCDYIHDWKLYSERYPEDVKFRSNYYKLTTKPTIKDWVYYGIVARVYVRDAEAMLAKITQKIDEYAVGKNVFMCHGEEILKAFNEVFENPIISKDFELSAEESKLNSMNLKMPKRNHPRRALNYKTGFEYNRSGFSVDEIDDNEDDDEIPSYMLDFSPNSSEKIIKTKSSVTVDDVDTWIEKNIPKGTSC